MTLAVKNRINMTWKVYNSTEGFVFCQRLADSDYVDSFTDEILRKHTNEDRIRYAWDQFLILEKKYMESYSSVTYF